MNPPINLAVPERFEQLCMKKLHLPHNFRIITQIYMGVEGCLSNASRPYIIIFSLQSSVMKVFSFFVAFQFSVQNIYKSYDVGRAMPSNNIYSSEYHFSFP